MAAMAAGNIVFMKLAMMATKCDQEDVGDIASGVDGPERS